MPPKPRGLNLLWTASIERLIGGSRRAGKKQEWRVTDRFSQSRCCFCSSVVKYLQPLGPLSSPVPATMTGVANLAVRMIHPSASASPPQIMRSKVAPASLPRYSWWSIILAGASRNLYPSFSLPLFLLLYQHPNSQKIRNFFSKTLKQ